MGRAPESTQPLEKGICNTRVACTGGINKGGAVGCAVSNEEAPLALCGTAAKDNTVGVKEPASREVEGGMPLGEAGTIEISATMGDNWEGFK